MRRQVTTSANQTTWHCLFDPSFTVRSLSFSFELCVSCQQLPNMFQPKVVPTDGDGSNAVECLIFLAFPVTRLAVAHKFHFQKKSLRRNKGGRNGCAKTAMFFLFLSLLEVQYIRWYTREPKKVEWLSTTATVKMPLFVTGTGGLLTTLETRTANRYVDTASAASRALSSELWALSSS